MEMGKRVATGRNWSGIFMVLVGVVVIAGLSYSVGLNNGDAKDSIERGGEIPNRPETGLLRSPYECGREADAEKRTDGRTFST